MAQIQVKKKDKKAIVNDFFDLLSNSEATLTLEDMHFSFPPSKKNSFSEIDQYKQAAITILAGGNSFSEETKKELLNSIGLTELQMLAFNSYNARIGAATTKAQKQEKPKRKYNTEKKQQQLATAQALIDAGKTDKEISKETGLKIKRVAKLRIKASKEKKTLNSRFPSPKEALKRAPDHISEKGIDTHYAEYSLGIVKTDEFKKKGLAEYAANVGLKCANCLYCSTKTMRRTMIGKDAYRNELSLIDPDGWMIVEHDAKNISLEDRGLVQVCTMTDAWSDNAHKFRLGRRFLGSILGEPGWTVRILTKCCAVEDDFDLIEKYKERIIFGMSTTMVDEQISDIVEYGASPQNKRLELMRKAKKNGFRVFGMLCPIMPSALRNDYEVLFRNIADLEPESIFAEPINPRGNALTSISLISKKKNHPELAASIDFIRKMARWADYVAEFIEKTQELAKKYYSIDKINMLIDRHKFVSKRMTDKDDTGVIWLTKETKRKKTIEALAQLK